MSSLTDGMSLKTCAIASLRSAPPHVGLCDFIQQQPGQYVPGRSQLGGYPHNVHAYVDTQDLRRTANSLQLHLDLVSSRKSMITVRTHTYSQVIVHASGNYVSSTRWVPQGSHAVEVVSSGCFWSRTSLSISTDAIHNPSGYKGLPVNQCHGRWNGTGCCTHLVPV